MDKERLFLLDDIASAEFKLARMDYLEVSQEAYKFIGKGEFIPDDIRFRLQDAYMKLESAREKRAKAAEALRNATYQVK